MRVLADATRQALLQAKSPDMPLGVQPNRGPVRLDGGGDQFERIRSNSASNACPVP